MSNFFKKGRIGNVGYDVLVREGYGDVRGNIFYVWLCLFYFNYRLEGSKGFIGDEEVSSCD